MTISRLAREKRTRKNLHRSASSGSKLVFIPRAWQRRWQTATVAESFRHAIRGLQMAFRSERNLRIHFAIAAAVTGAAVILKVDAIGACMLALSIGFVIIAELLNTALERFVDVATDGQYHRLARDAKDAAAAAVLFASGVAVVVGLLVFIPCLAALP